GGVLETIGVEGAVRERAATTIPSHIAVVAAPGNVGNPHTVAEAQSRERIRVGIASDAISRNPTVRIAVKAVIEVDRAMKGNIEQRAQFAAGKRDRALSCQRAIGRW